MTCPRPFIGGGAGRSPVHPVARARGVPGLSVYWQYIPTHGPGSYGDRVDNQAAARDFLRTRRARLTPQRAGIIGGGRRRVTGLRREEVATLAGVSTDYYAKMERGTLAGVSPEILDAVARALQLDDAETEHLHDLARAAGPARLRSRGRAVTSIVRPSLQRLLDAITEAPAWVTNPRRDTLATNALGRALLAPMLETRPAAATTPATSSSAPQPATSTRTGSRPPTAPWPRCAQRPAATHATSH